MDDYMMELVDETTGGHSAQQAFLQRAQCLVDQYSSFTYFNLSLDGQRTLGENIADYSGINRAWESYVDYSNEQSRLGQPLPQYHPNYSNDQLFWIWSLSSGVKQIIISQQLLRFNEMNILLGHFVFAVHSLILLIFLRPGTVLLIHIMEDLETILSKTEEKKQNNEIS
jgi:hypothetical protein